MDYKNNKKVTLPYYKTPAENGELQKYFNIKENFKMVKNINERIWCPKFGSPTLLQLAIFYGNERFVDWLLDKNADVNIVTEIWGTALHVAVKLKRFYIIQKLFHAGAIIDKIASEKNCTPIYYLMEKEDGEEEGNWAPIIILFIKKRLDVDEICLKRSFGPSLTLLDVALKNNDTKAIKCLLDVGASVDRVDDSNKTPLEIAEISKCKKSIEVIKDYIIKLKTVGLPVSDRNWKAVTETNYRNFEDLKFKCLMEIQLMKDLDPVLGITYDKVFSESDEELKIFQKFLRSDIVAFYDNVKTKFKLYHEIMFRRVRYATNINLSNSELRAEVDYYERRQNFKDVKWVNKRLKCREYGDPTLLQFAAYCEDELFVSRLLQRKANIHYSNRVWGSALHIAVRQHNIIIASKLLGAGAKVEKLGTKLNCTPIFHLLRHKSSFWIPMVETLMDFGLDINDVCIEASDRKLVPLEVAIINGNEAAVKSLLDMGADVDRVNSDLNLLPLQLVDTCQNLPNFSTIKEIIMNHIVKLLSAGGEVSERNRDAVIGYNFELKKACIEEIERMKAIIYPDTELTYYDILTKSDNELVRIFIRYDSIVTHKGAFHQLFRIYEQLVSYKIFRVKCCL